MAESHVVSALVQKHARLKGELFYHQKAVERLQKALEATGQSIRLFDPSRNVRNIKAVRRYQRSEYFKQGECSRLVLDVLRESEAPMTSQQVTDEIVRAEDLVLDDIGLVEVRRTVLNVLKGLARRGEIVKTPAIAGINTWSVA